MTDVRGKTTSQLVAESNPLTAQNMISPAFERQRSEESNLSRSSAAQGLKEDVERAF